MNVARYTLMPLSRQRDALPLIALALLAVIISFRAFADVASYIRGDWPTMFVPIYAFLGERLRAFDIPGPRVCRENIVRPGMRFGFLKSS